ncbi:hypothetical protein BOX15_Mlig006033g1 [Macrostomum lignano]|uniref:Ig-like domain-containing protein n=1 Tax=Macrostomum lignano TaxID=282301 RepID=A0A267EYV0_9PLAT|nr:hypothetical protein BOX15_Mlig006033g1 [Macrostomum lignano]
MTAQHRLLTLSLLLLGCLATSRATLVVTGTTYTVKLVEGREGEPKYVLSRQYLDVLECSMYASDSSKLVDPKIDWKIEGSNDTLDSRFSFSGRLSEDKKNFTSTLSVRRPENKHVTNYTCTGSATDQPEAQGRARLQSKPLISFKIDGVTMSDVGAWPGQDIQMSCIVEGNPAGSPEWKREKDGATIGNGTANLVLEAVNYDEHRGFYTCSANNSQGTNAAKIFLRVKHPQAYLTPMIIIIVEVIIIAIIVVVYEYFMYKKHKQAEAEGEAYKTD